MRRKQSDSKKRRLRQAEEVAAAAYSIGEFCAAHRISEMTYHRLQREGLGPRIMKVRNRTIISTEAAAAWRRERERVAPSAAHLTPEPSATYSVK